jgi:hypothetical protein
LHIDPLSNLGFEALDLCLQPFEILHQFMQQETVMVCDAAIKSQLQLRHFAAQRAAHLISQIPRSS